MVSRSVAPSPQPQIPDRCINLRERDLRKSLILGLRGQKSCAGVQRRNTLRTHSKEISRCLRGRVCDSSPLRGTRKCPSYPSRVVWPLASFCFSNQGSRCSAKIRRARLLKQCPDHTHPISQFKLRREPIATSLQLSSVFIGCRHSNS